MFNILNKPIIKNGIGTFTYSPDRKSSKKFGIKELNQRGS